MKLARFLLRTLKGIYDILATYLLLFILPFALVAFGFHVGLELVAAAFGFDDAANLWATISWKTGVDPIWFRIALFAPAHVGLWWLLRKPRQVLQPYLERAFDAFVSGFKWLTSRLPALRTAGELAFSLVVTLLLIPFVIQPTLVPELTKSEAWVERVANLLDGTATAAIADSVVGLYRKLYADPVVSVGAPDKDLDVFDQTVDDVASGPIAGPSPSGKQPLMDRWDPYILQVAGDDTEKFAMIKAFMWVESGGRQYAVSHTGCSGLMQFCAGTARSRPFREIFGTGQVYVCKCDGPCRVGREVQRDLESGDPDAFERHADAFPCDFTDARFDPAKAIRAGGRYVEDLRSALGGNVYLMYIGYNSGPGVAKKVYRQLGAAGPAATPAEIEPYLADALRPHFGPASDSRARSLVRTHLPKIGNAFARYSPGGAVVTVAATPPPVPVVAPPPKPDPKPRPRPRPRPKADAGRTNAADGGAPSAADAGPPDAPDAGHSDAVAAAGSSDAGASDASSAADVAVVRIDSADTGTQSSDAADAGTASDDDAGSQSGVLLFE